MREFKRIWSWKMQLLLLIVVLVNLAMFVYSQTNGKGMTDVSKDIQWYHTLVEKYKIVDEQVALAELEEMKFAIKRGELEGNAEVVNRLFDKITYLASYQQGIQQVFANAEQLQTFSLFSDPESYTYNDILKTAHDFENVKDVEVFLDNDMATDKMTNYYILFYIAFGLMIVIIYSMQKERENGIWPIIHVAKSGRMRLAITRFLIVSVSSLIITGILYATTFLASLILYGGAGDLTNPVQTISRFAQFPYTLSKIGYIGINFFVSWGALWSVSCILWMMFTIFKNRNAALGITAVITGIEVLLFQAITVQSVFRMFRHINIINLFRMSDILSTYRNCGSGKMVFSVLSVLLVSMAVIAAISSVLSVIIYVRMRPSVRKTLLDRVFEKLSEAYQKFFVKFPQLLKEIHKLVISGKGIWIIIVVLILSIYFITASKMKFSEVNIQNDAAYLEQGGEDYSEIAKLVYEKVTAMEKAQLELNDAQIKYNSQEMEIDEYLKYASNANYARDELKKVSEFMTKIQYLEELKADRGISGYLMSDRGYEEIFGPFSLRRELILFLLIGAAIILGVADSISGEYASGMSSIIRSGVRGRQWTFRRKMGAAFIYSVFLYLLVYLLDYIFLYRYYGFPYMGAPVQSLTFMKDFPFQINVITYLILLNLMKFAIVMGITGILLFISAASKKPGSHAVIPVVLAGTFLLIVIQQGADIRVQMILSLLSLAVGAAAILGAMKVWSSNVS